MGLVMEKEVKVSEVVLCSGDCLSCNFYEQKPIEQEFVVSKKRVSTHYVVPDMTAIRILGEVEGNDIARDSLSDMSQAELEEICRQKLAEMERVGFVSSAQKKGRKTKVKKEK